MKYLIVLSFAFLLSSCGDDDGWEDLFNGRNLSGWHVYGGDSDFNGWDVQDGVLLFDPAQRTTAQSANLMTNDQYTNFELSLEWMIGENGNSGLFWGVVEDDKYEHPYQTGAEIQILDDGWTDYIEERGDINRAGSLYGMIPPSEIVSKSSGQWNKYLLHIDHKENLGYLIFNDVKVVEFPVHGDEWEQMIANSTFAGWDGFGQAQKGYICLQDYGGKVAFRNVRIKELP